MKPAGFGVSFRYYLRRCMQDPIGILIYVVLPMALVYILGYIYTQNSGETPYVLGYNMTSTTLSIGMMLFFQLAGGVYLLNFMDNDLRKPMKWRLKAAPCATSTLVFAAIAACLVINILQGLVIVACTACFLNAYWGNLWVTFLVIIFISIIAQLIGAVLFFLVRRLSPAEYLSWFVAWIMAVLGGLMFSLPDNGFFRFTQQYGTPFSLGRSAIWNSGVLGASFPNALLCLGLLAGIAAILTAIVIALGRRKLA